MKYGKATKITLDFGIADDMLILKLTGNGVGFIVDKGKSGNGIANMKTRAELFSGSFLINSSTGNGCSVSVKVPMISNNLV